MHIHGNQSNPNPINPYAAAAEKALAANRSSNIRKKLLKSSCRGRKPTGSRRGRHGLPMDGLALQSGLEVAIALAAQASHPPARGSDTRLAFDAAMELQARRTQSPGQTHYD